MPRPRFVWRDRGYGAVTRPPRCCGMRRRQWCYQPTNTCLLTPVVAVLVVACRSIGMVVSVRGHRCPGLRRDVRHGDTNDRDHGCMKAPHTIVADACRSIAVVMSPPHSRGRAIQKWVVACGKLGKFQTTHVVAKCDATRTLDPNQIKVSDGQTNEKRTVK